VHALLQIERAGDELRILGVVRHAPPVQVGERARQRLEVVRVILLEVQEQHVAEVQIADVSFGQLLRVVTARLGSRRGAKRHDGGEKQRAH